MEQNPSPPTPVSPPKQPRKKLVGIIITVVVVVIVIITVIGAITYNTTVNNSVTVTAVDLSIVYNGVTSGYLGPTSQSLGGFTTTAGGKGAASLIVPYSITFTSSAVLLTHSITSIYTTTPGFSILSISPNLPYSLSPGSTGTITIIIQAPSYYNGVLQIIIETS